MAAVHVAPQAHEPRFTEHTDLRQFIRQYRVYLDLAQIAPGNHAVQLQHLACALPAQYFALLDAEVIADPNSSFRVITERLLSAAGVTPPDSDAQRAEFESAQIAKGETFGAFSAKLTGLASKAYSDFSTADRTKLVLRRFVNGMLVTDVGNL